MNATTVDDVWTSPIGLPINFGCQIGGWAWDEELEKVVESGETRCPPHTDFPKDKDGVRD